MLERKLDKVSKHCRIPGWYTRRKFLNGEYRRGMSLQLPSVYKSNDSTWSKLSRGQPHVSDHLGLTFWVVA